MKTITYFKKIFQNIILSFLLIHPIETILGQCADLNPPLLILKELDISIRGNKYTLNATDFVFKATDDCSHFNDLKFSFAIDTNTKIKTFTMGLNPTAFGVSIFATDQSGKFTEQRIKLFLRQCPIDLICKTEVNIGLLRGSELTLHQDLFLLEEYCHDAQFEYYYYSTNNNQYVKFTKIDDSFPSNFPYKIVDLESGSSCIGMVNLTLLDCSLIADLFVKPTKNKTTSCFEDVSPEKLGFPVSYPIIANGINKYLVIVGNIKYNLSYSDNYIVKNCQNPNQGAQIERTWKMAENACNNALIEYIDLDQLVNLNNFKTNLFKDQNIYLNKQFSEINDDDIKSTSKEVIDNLSFQCNKFYFSYRDISFKFEDLCEGSYYKVLRNWEILDWCTGNVYNYIQVILIWGSNRDSIPPVLICKNFIHVYMPDNALTLELWARDFTIQAYDSCGIISYSFDKQGKQVSRVFNRQDISKTFALDIYVIDRAGNQSHCETSVTIVGKVETSSKTIVNGKIFNYLLQPIKNTLINLNFTVIDERQMSIQSTICDNIAPNYKVCIDSNLVLNKFYLEPNLNKSTVGTITFKDILLIYELLFGTSSLNAIQKIAADVNCDKEINIYDAFNIRQHILGQTNLICDDVLFFTADTISPKEIKTLELMPVANLDFVPIKKGDVNGSGINFKANEENYSRSEPIEIICEDRIVKNGEIVDLWFAMKKPTDVYGIQFSALTPSANYSVINASSPMINLTLTNDYVINKDDWRVLMLKPDAQLFNIVNRFFKLRIQVNRDGMLSEIINFTNGPLEALFITEDFKLVAGKFLFQVSTNTDKFNGDDETASIYPNPFLSECVVTIPKNMESKCTISIADLTGEIFMSRIYYNQSKIIISDKDLPKTGVYLIKIFNQNAEKTFKLIKI